MNSFVPSSRFAPPEKLKVTLVSASPPAGENRTWDGEAAKLISAMSEPKPGAWRVTGVADSGITSLVVDAVMARIKSGISPSKLLVLATSKESAALLRRQFAHLLPSVGFASESPMVRSVHSFAFALVRSARLRQPEAQDDATLGKTPRLITGAHQDLIIQELLHIHAESPESYWPEQIREALTLVGFARQLRDFLLRAQERGLGPEDVAGLGREHGRPMWVAAGRFLQEYEQISQLSGAQLYNASELVVTALGHLNADPDFLADMQGKVDSVFVDDAQNLDPKSAELVSTFASSAQCTVIAGNPEHSVYHFRGATPDFLKNFPAGNEVVLDRRRHAPAQRIHYAESSAMEKLVVADTLRRAHLIDGIAWKDMAVIVRSSGSIATVRRALLSAGVPVALEPTALVLSEQRLVSGLLLALKAVQEPLSARELEELLLGPIGGADAVTLRRLLRGLRQAEMKIGGTRRASDVLAQAVASPGQLPDSFMDHLTPRERDILERVTAVIAAGRTAQESGASIELVLWEVWDATGLSDRLMAASLRGGAVGSQADIDLDAVMALFDTAGDFVERNPRAPLERFVESITSQDLPSGTRDRRGFEPDAVSVLTAHGSFGQQWPVVVVHGVQEGVWPALGETGSFFGQEELVELHDRGIDPNIITSKTADKVAEERRLFGLASSRATEVLAVTAVVAPDSDEVDEPSRFLEELSNSPDVQVSYDGARETFAEYVSNDQLLGEQQRFPRLLSVPSIVAELRRALTEPSTPPEARAEAARQLARLAEAGVYGAHPDHWWGLAAPSEQEPVLRPAPRVRLSPSKIESALVCPLRTVFSSYGEDDDSPLYLYKGILIHAGAEAFAAGVPRGEIEEILLTAFIDNTEFPVWQRDNEVADFRRTVTRTMDWLGARTFELVGAEISVDVEVSKLADGTPIDIYGRMDRLEREDNGNLWVIDLKTGKTAVTDKKISAHPQLFAYQLALAGGEIVEGKVEGRGQTPNPEALGGGVLVYPATDNKGVTTRAQAPKTTEELDEFASLLPGVVAAMTGPTFKAVENSACSNCVLKKMCPAHPEGKALTDV
ncbi:ATP-dependent DNA helicase PcrA [Corynebacterium kalinowskii]|uniref:DNA 3'-5' helicase n=1 Tax=Corynebacterium kalinowskii TaxID=2675216 RepID=A0A6B8VI21_9CORY|nr:ATP-dependent DNA helicase [Corynebacterium kalinowskii]QGU02659.1 ATP-dependent DNA helicase PcrA [Corynebacterium kalinowskii]